MRIVMSLIIIGSLFLGCGDTLKEKYFEVVTIQTSSVQNMCWYTCKNSPLYFCFIDSINKFSIGDTLILCKNPTIADFNRIYIAPGETLLVE